MDEILANIERQVCAFQILDENSQAEDNLSECAPAFVSVIKINGKPIPPPVMTQQRRLEMRQLRSTAMKREQERANQRRLRLLEKVQTIVNGIEERRSSSQASEVDDNLTPANPETDTSLNLANHSETPDDLSITPTETTDHLRPLEHLHRASNLSMSLSPDAEILQHIPYPTGGITTTQGSTSSSSDTSLLNQTVVAVSDFSKSPTDKEDSSSTPVDDLEVKVSVHEEKHFNPSLSEEPKVTAASLLSLPESHSTKSDTSSSNPVYESSEASSPKTDHDMTQFKHTSNASGGTFSSPGTITGVKLACSWNKETDKAIAPKSVESIEGENLTVTRLHLMPSLSFNQYDEDDVESVGDQDSYLSLLGEYTSLPMPTGSSHFFSDVSEVPSSTPLDNPIPILIEKYLEKTQKSPTEKFDESPNNVSSPREDDLSMFLSTSSILLTNTLGQSCTLPSSLRTVSAASTLQDVDDPWNTLIETPVPTNDHFEGHPDISASRGTPVGQEDSSGSNPTSATTINKASPGTSSSENEFLSPEKRVRRNSYTLDHPSPALLNAQARNEAPHAANLGDRESGSSANDKEVTIEKVKAAGSQNLEQNKEPTDENLLHMQLQYFEEMRQHMEQQQRQQLQQLLIEQQQAQIALQQEMAQLERRFRQKQEQAGSGEDGRAASLEDVPVTREVNQYDAHFVTSPSPTSVISKKSSQHTSSSDVPPKCTSPSVTTKVSPTFESTSTVGSGGRIEPFYLGGDQSRLVVGGSSVSPVAVRSPGVGENVSPPVMVDSPYNKLIISPSMRMKFDKVSATVKGYLTRRIFKMHKVEAIIKTIKDSAAFADKFISETPIKKGGMSMQDMALAERVLAQVRAAQYDLYDIFHTLSIAERMELIGQSRRLSLEDGQRKVAPKPDKAPPRPLSAATVKALERKRKGKEAEARLFGDNKSVSKAGAPSSRSRPVSAAEGRILKPLLSQKSPARPVSANTYRPSKYGSVIHQDPPKSKDPKKLTHDPIRSKVTTQKAPGSTTQWTRSTKARSPVTVKTKGVRRSLYPITNPSKKAPRRTTDVRK